MKQKGYGLFHRTYCQEHLDICSVVKTYRNLQED